MTLTTEQLDELEAKARAATPERPGPYRIQWADESRIGIDFILDARGDVVVEADSGVYHPRGAVAEHIAANSPDVTLRLVAVYRAALAWNEARSVHREACERSGATDATLPAYQRAIDKLYALMHGVLTTEQIHEALKQGHEEAEAAYPALFGRPGRYP